MSDLEYSDHGIPIFTVSRKIEALRHCMTDESIIAQGELEDAMGHLMDLVYYVAPDWKFCRFDGIQAIADYYGKHPTPIKPDERSLRGRYPGKLSLAEYDQLVEWFRDANRKAAHLRFTQGLLRDVASAFEATQREVS